MTEPGVPHDLQAAFEDVVVAMGSVRVEAFEQLRRRPELAGFRDDLDALAQMDKESTTFEAGVRDLQQRAYGQTRR